MIGEAVERIAANYSASADGYAEFWSPVIRPVGRRLLATLAWDRVSRVVDVGTGTGALLPDIVGFVPAAQIIGVDCSAGMLALARRPGIRLAAMDAMRLALRTGAFDVAVMAFMLFHAPDPRAALAEARRILRARGALGLVTWMDDSPPPAGHIWNEELDAYEAWDPSPVPHADDQMDTPAKVTDLLAAAGFTLERAWVEHVEHQWDVGRFMGLHTRFGATKRRLDTLDPTRRQAFLTHIGARMAELGPKAFLYHGMAICAVAAA